MISIYLTGFNLIIILALINDCHTQLNGLHGHKHPHLIKSIAPCPPCLDGRLIQHYLQRKCKPVIPGGCQCPSRFNCLEYFDENLDGKFLRPGTALISSRSSNNGSIRGRAFEDNDTDYNMDDYYHCHYNGKQYDIGETVPIEDPCRICICHYMSDGTLNIDCQAKIECPPSTELKNLEERNLNGYLVQPNLNPMALVMFRHRQQLRRRRRPQQSSPGVNNNSNDQQSLLTLHCYDYYQHDKCCPRQECMPINSRTGKSLQQRKQCKYANKQFNLGEKIPLKILLKKSNDLNNEDEDQDDPMDNSKSKLLETLSCLNCICTEQWNNTIMEQQSNNLNPEEIIEILLKDQLSCRRKSCYLDLDSRFRSGCIPVYDQLKCCPVDFICPRTRQMALRVRGVDYGSKMCHFEGRKYPIGAKIYQNKNLAADCVDCECLVPPEFTCLKQKDCQQ